MVFDGKELHDVGAQDVPVIDTVGAGYVCRWFYVRDR